MTKLKIVQTAMAAAVLATAVALTSPLPSTTMPDSCTQASLCAYVNSGFRTNQGYELMPVDSAPLGSCQRPTFPNAWSGVWNGTGRVARMYKNASCTGDVLTFVNGDGHSQFSVAHPTFENNIESFRIG